MTDVLSCRLPEREAENLRAVASLRGEPVSHVIRALVNREISDTLAAGVTARNVR